MKRIAVALVLLSMVGCRDDRTVVYQQVPQPMPQTVVYEDRHLSAGDAAVIAGSVIAGAVVADYLINGRPRPGYVIMGGQVYRDSPQVQNVYKRTTVVNKTVVINKTVVNNAPASSNTANANVSAKPSNNIPGNGVVPTNVKKEKNPGDAAAEQIRKNDALKAELKAKQEARASAPKPSSGFNSMSKSASSSSSSGSRRK